MSLKFLKVGSTGFHTEESAIITSAGAGDASKIIGTDAGGKLDSSFLPSGIGGDTRTVTAGEALSGGDLVYLDSSGEALKADANAVAKAAVGFVQSAISNGATGTAQFGSGIITGLSSLTPGAAYFLSTTPGAITTTPPSGSADIVQPVGYALSATELYFEPQNPTVLA